MIVLTKLDDNKLLLNMESVKFMESTPDTLIFFLNGDTVMVRESLEEISKKVLEYQSRILRQQ